MEFPGEAVSPLNFLAEIPTPTERLVSQRSVFFGEEAAADISKSSMNRVVDSLQNTGKTGEKTNQVNLNC